MVFFWTVSLAACKLAILPACAIRQEEVESLISLENKIRALQDERDALAEDLMSRRLAGVSVAPGLYSLEVAERTRAGRREFRLVVR
ncbi:MAG: hypothetical protein ACK5AZ_07880 [Bryobacteraceae bacterium]